MFGFWGLLFILSFQYVHSRWRYGEKWVINLIPLRNLMQRRRIDDMAGFRWWNANRELQQFPNKQKCVASFWLLLPKTAFLNSIGATVKSPEWRQFGSLFQCISSMALMIYSIFTKSPISIEHNASLICVSKRVFHMISITPVNEEKTHSWM